MPSERPNSENHGDAHSDGEPHIETVTDETVALSTDTETERATGASTSPEEPLHADVRLLGDLLGETVREHESEATLQLIEGLRHAAIALREGKLDGGRDAFAEQVAALDLGQLEQVARAFTQFFHLVNVAEEEQRIRVLRQRDRPGDPHARAGGPEGSIGAACARLAREGASADEVRALLGRAFVMPVLTAHPTEARRRTLLDHLSGVSVALDRLDDPRRGLHERAETLATLRESVMALYCTEEARSTKPSPYDELRAGLHVFERTLLDVTPAIYRRLEDSLAAAWPGERFEVPPFLRWGTWIGGDRDGNPNVVAEITRTAFDRARHLALARYLADTSQLGRELSISARRVPLGGMVELQESLEAERARLPEVAARTQRIAAVEPWREKLWYIRARLAATQQHQDGGYPSPDAYLDDLRLLERSLIACGLERVARGRLRDARRRAEVFGFHLASMDLRQHSAIHETAVAELLARGGVDDYARLSEEARTKLLAGLLDRADLGVPRDRKGLSPATRELLATLDVVGRARRDLGPAACERYVISFTHAISDVLEVLFLCRAAQLAPDELRPVPLLEQLEDLERAEPFATRMLDLPPVRAALRGELEVMIGYSDSGKQAGYVASAAALYRAQEVLARVADEREVMLTVFHGRGGAIGRGGGPSHRAIRAQPLTALRGRLRVTEQGETITARYARPEIARRDLEQMLSAVLLGSVGTERQVPDAARRRARDQTVERGAAASRILYEALLADPERLARYAVAATPIQEVAELPIASRPTSRKAGLAFADLRAIPWVFSWNQSRHALPGWFGLGTALDTIAAVEGEERARDLYRTWPFFRALVDNAELALARADIDVAEHYARLAAPEDRTLFEPIREEHRRTVAAVRRIVGHEELLASHPALLQAVKRRNPYVDVLSHAQIELLRRLRTPTAAAGTAERIREILFITINGIAAGLQTAG